MNLPVHEDGLTRFLDGIFLGESGARLAASAAAWDWIITLAIGATGFTLAMVRSTWIVDYTVYVFVFNRGLRRLVDYYIHGEFVPLNPVSLTPLVVSGCMILPVILHLPRVAPKGRVILACLTAAMVYAFFIGFFRVGYGAVYALGEALAPISLFAFVMLRRPPTEVKDRWIRSFAWAAILTSAYGWYQYLNIPPWDGFWLVETGMYGYMGIPEPTKMTVFSTMAERGPLAGFLGFSVVPMIVSQRWRLRRGLLGWMGVVLVFSVILLTMSRSGVIFALLGTACYLFLNGGRAFGQVLVAAAVLGLAAWFGMDRIPNAERVIERFETLGELQEDGSYKGRVMIMSGGFRSLANRPLGMGLGAVGLGTRVNTGTVEAEAVIVDAGWFNILLVYGLPGSMLLLTAMLLAWSSLAERYRRPMLRDDHVLLGRALLLTLVPACFVGDLLTGFSIFWLALGCGIALPPPPRHPPGFVPRPVRAGSLY